MRDASGEEWILWSKDDDESAKGVKQGPGEEKGTALEGADSAAVLARIRRFGSGRMGRSGYTGENSVDGRVVQSYPTAKEGQQLGKVKGGSSGGGRRRWSAGDNGRYAGSSWTLGSAGVGVAKGTEVGSRV